MNNIKYCSFPETPKAALAALLDRRAEAMAVAGGTLVAKTLPDSVTHFVGLKKLPYRHIVKRGGDLVIGALASFDDIDRSRLTRGWAGGVLSMAAARCSSQLIRNMATIGGNIARPHSFNIFPAVLEGLDAGLRIISRSGIRTVPFSAVYLPDFRLKPGRDCVILEIIIPGKTRNWLCRFEKFARTETSWEAYFSLFMAAGVKAGVVREARVAVGALSPKPFRALSAEKFLRGRALSSASAAEAALELERDLDQLRAGDFRKEAAAALFGRFISSLSGERPGVKR